MTTRWALRSDRVGSAPAGTTGAHPTIKLTAKPLDASIMIGTSSAITWSSVVMLWVATAFLVASAARGAHDAAKHEAEETAVGGWVGECGHGCVQVAGWQASRAAVRHQRRCLSGAWWQPSRADHTSRRRCGRWRADTRCVRPTA